MIRTFWRIALGLIFLAGIYLFLPPSEIQAARAWMEMFLGRGR